MGSPPIPQNGNFNQSGIGYWMERVLLEREKVQADRLPIPSMTCGLRCGAAVRWQRP